MSANATAAREVALAVVRDVFGPQSRAAQAAFDVRARGAGLEARERAFAAELAYGSIKLRRLLDWQLQPYVGSRAKPLPATIAEILRLGVWQLHGMSGVDAHAAVSQSVELALRHGHRGTAGLVNAVMRRMQADGPRRPERTQFADEADYLGATYSVPTWLATRYVRALDGRAEAALAGVNAAPRAALRVDTRKNTRAAARVLLAQRGVATQPSAYVAETLLVDAGIVSDDPQGRWSIQGESAAMPVDLLAPQAGETVLEVCAGRGNKTLQIAARLQGRGRQVAVERDAKKSNRLVQVLERAGVAGVAVVGGDALEAVPEMRADAVLVDAPCSGLGIIGRHPEARWRKSPEDAARLAVAQTALLRAAAARTKPGGRLVYSVCSLDPLEGPEVAAAFLASDPDFTRAALPATYTPFAAGGDVVVPPGIDGRDGFYIATFVRSA